MGRYDDVAAKIDAFFTRVEDRHGGDMQCRTGCSDCCQPGLTVTRLEAAAIRATAVADRPWGEVPGRCAALGTDGRCRIYAARPFVCRSHGAPIRMRVNSLPVIDSCFRNFRQVTADADCILDQTTLSAISLAANDGDDERIDLAELLLDCAPPRS